LQPAPPRYAGRHNRPQLQLRRDLSRPSHHRKEFLDGDGPMARSIR
jgi:hypothetical protein